MKHYKNALIGVGCIGISSLACFIFFFWALNSLYDPKEIEIKGHKHYAKKQYHQAYLDFKLAVENNIKNRSSQQVISEGYRLAASAAHADQHYSQAATMLRKSISYNIDNELAHHIIQHMLQRHQMKQADVWEISQSEWSQRYRAQSTLNEMIKKGHAHYAKKRYAEAFKNFSYAADQYQAAPTMTDKQKSQYFRYAATAAYAAQQRHEAKKYATRALQYDPANADAKSLLQKAGH